METSSPPSLEDADVKTTMLYFWARLLMSFKLFCRSLCRLPSAFCLLVSLWLARFAAIFPVRSRSVFHTSLRAFVSPDPARYFLPNSCSAVVPALAPISFALLRKQNGIAERTYYYSIAWTGEATDREERNREAYEKTKHKRSKHCNYLGILGWCPINQDKN